jgi:hypothetical protein
MIRRFAYLVPALAVSLLLAGSYPSFAQSNPCAAKNPCGAKNPCAAKTEKKAAEKDTKGKTTKGKAAENPCAAKK